VTYMFSASLAPVAEVEAGERVIFETLDAVGGRIQTEEDALTKPLLPSQSNPATGPLAIRGAIPGDTLSVTIVDIALASVSYGLIRAGSGVITDELEAPAAKLPVVGNGIICFDDHIRFSARPMVGVIGVAPATEDVQTFFPGSHGGNLDINAIAPGSIVYLPVRVAGALLCLGDVHARMGDGELTGGGLDIAAEVTVEVALHRHLEWSRPVIETREAWCTCAHAARLEDAIRQATSDMTSLLSAALNLSREEAFILIGSAADARIGQAAGLGIDVTAYVSMSKEILRKAF
jgi:amidase